MLRIGIDLGTTFSAMAWVNPDSGRPEVILNSDGEKTLPSVQFCFDGRQAWIGKKAEMRKQTHPDDVYELVKQKMGKHRTGGPGIDPDDVESYLIGGYAWGAVGLSALILRKLKRDAIRHFKRAGLVNASAAEADITIDAVITVPASFHDVERQATVRAGWVAGLNVTAIVNEPTAAAIASGAAQDRDARIMVFDLGGGTCDVTILEGRLRDSPRVRSTAGDNSLGGHEWDAIIGRHLGDAFFVKHGRDIVQDQPFEVQRRAIEAKHALTAAESTTAELSFDEGHLEAVLYRSRPASLGRLESDGRFYLEDRASSLLVRCRELCRDALREATITTGGFTRSMEWNDIDEVILAGGSCRMPMIVTMMEQMAGRTRVRQQRTDFDYDTAIAMGAALRGHQRGGIVDVMSHTIGIVVSDHRGRWVLPMIAKNTELPVEHRHPLPAKARTSVDIVEITPVENDALVRPEDGRLWGSFALDNPTAEPEVVLTFRADESGVITVRAFYPPDVHRELTLGARGLDGDEELEELREHVLAVRIHD